MHHVSSCFMSFRLDLAVYQPNKDVPRVVFVVLFCCSSIRLALELQNYFGLFLAAFGQMFNYFERYVGLC